jgi:hypothetical protein
MEALRALTRQVSDAIFARVHPSWPGLARSASGGQAPPLPGWMTVTCMVTRLVEEQVCAENAK